MAARRRKPDKIVRPPLTLSEQQKRRIRFKAKMSIRRKIDEIDEFAAMVAEYALWKYGNVED